MTTEQLMAATSELATDPLTTAKEIADWAIDDSDGKLMTSDEPVELTSV